jgi:acylphosphatase
MGNLVALKTLIYGRVQGVYYRAFVQRIASQNGLTGYARNLPDGSVEVCAEGEKKLLEQLLESLKEGPPGARVDELDPTWLEPGGKFKDFSITR